MFKFNFNVIEEGGEDSPFSKSSVAIACSEYSDDKNESVTEIKWYDSKRILLKPELFDNINLYRLNATEKIIGDVSLKYMITGFILRDPTYCDGDDDSKKNIKSAEKSHSDLLPGIYEGGAKIWECTDDLLNFLMQKKQKLHEWKGKRVLDLGCGSGLLGCLAYKSGAIVEFQDYNQDVLENITMPNFILNVSTPPNTPSNDVENLNNEFHFYSGDWANYVNLTSTNDDSKKFDFIVTAETIYNIQNQQKLLNTFKEKLKTNGIVYVAAKTYYFGVGGGMRQFEELVTKDKHFQSTIVWTTNEDGVSREILLLKRL